MKTLSFSLCDTDAIVHAVAKRAPKGGYPMNLVGSEAEWVKDAVNQGIDSRLEACNVPDRGDRYEVKRPGADITSRVRGTCLVCNVSAQSLPVLVRRLLEDARPDSPSGDHPMLLASSICGTLDIECV